MARRTKRRNTRKGSGKRKSRRKYVRKYTRKYKNARHKTRKNKYIYYMMKRTMRRKDRYSRKRKYSKRKTYKRRINKKMKGGAAEAQEVGDGQSELEQFMKDKQLDEKQAAEKILEQEYHGTWRGLPFTPALLNVAEAVVRAAAAAAQDKVRKFIEITELSEFRAILYLEQTSYDLEKAVYLFLEDPTIGVAAAAAPAAAPAPAPAPAPAYVAPALGMCPYCPVKGQPSMPLYLGHPYCGRTCASAAAAAGWVAGSPPAGGAPGTHPILFYKKEYPFYEFTNYYTNSQSYLFNGDHSGDISREPWKTTEHYFQVYKFLHSSANIPEIYNQAKDLPTGNNGLSAMGPLWGSAIAAAGPTGQGPPHPVNNGYWHGRGPAGDLTPGKLRAMYNAVKMKFTQNNDLNLMLIGTGDTLLIENAGPKNPPYPGDYYWGDGIYGDPEAVTSRWDLSKIGDTKGENKLGLLLMQIRDELTGGNTCPDRAHIVKDRSYDHTTRYFNLQTI
jgi:predicted NAD-dependent protein-ADP-ribosyltransferase YbiA (DUF1768 family)